ncbi:MAG: leucine-rich repeat domain-containing protein [Lachnospiraceae bacterium]|nr:leucine-rich repeat domain-containing protein [Lachnospiraceae bacterium]
MNKDFGFKRRIMAFGLTCMMVLMSGVVMPVTTGTDVSRAASTALQQANDGFYLVSSFADLETMQDMIEGTYDGNDSSVSNFRLNGDIVGAVGAVSYIYPIGDANGGIAFSGEFDGNHKTISGITIMMDDACYENVGLFEITKGAYIHDLTFDNCKVEWDPTVSTPVNSSNVGLIAGQIGGSRIYNISINNCDCNPQVPNGSTIGNINYIAGIQTGSDFSGISLQGNKVINLPDSVTPNSKQGALDNTITSGANPGGNTPGGNTPGGSGNDSGATSGSSVAVGDAFVNNKIKYVVGKGDTLEVKGLSDKSVKHLKIPDAVKIGDKAYRVTRIAAKAFSGNKKLLSAKIGKNIEFIGKEAFKNCTKLKEAVIGKSVKETSLQISAVENMLGAAGVVNVTISASSFENCSSLSKVIISVQVRVIGNRAFGQCSSLRSIVIYSKVLKVVGKKALKGVNRCKISVPKIKLKPYKALLKNKGQGRKVVVIKMK